MAMMTLQGLAQSTDGLYVHREDIVSIQDSNLHSRLQRGGDVGLAHDRAANAWAMSAMSLMSSSTREVAEIRGQD